MNLKWTVLVSGLLMTNVAHGLERVCAPDSLMKVVARADIPGVPDDAFASAAKTVYRSGSRYGRIEEAYNPQTGLQLLVVVNEPHLWVVNRRDNSGEHMLDPGPTTHFRALVFPPELAAGDLPRRLELGCEAAWLIDAGATLKRYRHESLGLVERLEYTEGGERVWLYQRAGKPVRVEMYKDGKLAFRLNYVEYVQGLEFDPAMFTRPDGVRFKR